MKRWLGIQSLSAALPLFFAIAACGGAQKTDTTATGSAAGDMPADPVAHADQAAGPAPVAKDAPSEVIASVGAASVSDFLRRSATFANAIQPGAGLMLVPTLIGQSLGEMVDHMRLGGLDFAKPMHLIVLVVDGQPAILVAAHVADEAELRASLDPSKGEASFRLFGDKVAIGSKSLLNLASDYALTKLWDVPAPTDPTATVYLGKVWETWGPMIEMGLAAAGDSMNADPMTAKMMTAYFDGVLAMMKQSSTWTIALGTDGKEAELRFGFTGKPDTTLAKFAQGQQPASYELVSSFADGNAAMAFGGRLDWQALKPWFVTLTQAMMGPGSDKTLEPALGAWLGAMRGDMGGTMSMAKPFDFVMAAHVDDVKAVQSLLRDWGKLVATMKGGPMTFAAKTPAFSYKGTPVTSLIGKLDIKKLPAEQAKKLEEMFGKKGWEMFMAVGNGHLLSVGGNDGRKRITKLLDDKNLGKAPAAAGSPIAKAIDASKARKESMIVFLDMASMMRGVLGQTGPATASSDGFAMGLGFSGTTTTLRMTLPATHIKQLQTLKP